MKSEIKTKNITVEGKEFKCLEAYGMEYENCGGCGYPILPYRYERIINDSRAYLVDSAGIVWVLENNKIDNTDYGLCFDRPCLKWCLDYIMYYDPIFSDRLPSEVLDAIKVCDPRVNIYNAIHIGIMKPAINFDDLPIVE